jgi:polyferredoxin
LLFFSQLILGLFGYERFLMTGKLHLPVPMMILAGPIYRGHISVMTILFISTVVLSGPAWCSHFCYFGAIDGLASGGKMVRVPIRNKWILKSTVVILVILAAILLRWMKVPVLTATILAAGFGIVGLGVILLVSRKEGRMVHCTSYCPIGTIVNLTRFVNPFRMYIDNHSCTDCMACARSCKYDALNPTDITARKPGITCTLCGDCVSSCHAGSIKYKFLRLSPVAARNLYLLITISLHASTIALARI